MRHVIAALILIAVAGGPARAQRKVALAPLSTLGEETRSKAVKAMEKAIAAGLRSFPGIVLIDGDEVARAIKAAKRAELRACDGEAACLAQLGTLVGATDVVYGEIGGLGDAQVAYLKLIDVGRAAEVRSTTLEAQGPEAKAAARGAAFRLLDPDKYVGRMVCKVDVDGATIYVNGARQARSPARPITLPVGTHALRIAHPEFRDFVRFVDVGFDRDVVVEAPMQQFPIISKDIVTREGGGTSVVYRGVEPTPWYRQWYTVAGAGVVLFAGSVALFAAFGGDLDFDAEKIVGGP